MQLMKLSGPAEPTRTTGVPAAGPPPVQDTRVRAVRAGALRSMLVPGATAGYVACTWDAPHRPAMLAVAGGMLLVAVLTAWRASTVAASRARVQVQGGGVVCTLGGCAALSLLDGGVAAPLGALVPFALVYLAIRTPPWIFAAVAAFGATAYWTVALTGPPAPTGYAVVYSLGLTGVAYGCLRHAAALTSLRRRLAEVSRVDPLTRCLNRRGLDERLEQELAESARTGDPVTLVLADLDRFKEVNDRYGHHAGDELLAWTGRTMRRALRSHDAVGRLGGDEFGAILADTDAAGARVVAGRLRTALAGAAPASVGHATYPAEAGTLDDLRHLADERVYRDKVARDRRVPSADAVARARTPGAGGAGARVSRRERRRRSITDIGWNAVSNCSVGLLYGAVLAGHRPGRLPIVALCVVGLLGGLAIVAAADRLSRSRNARRVMVASAAGLYCLASTATVLDGGVGSAMGLAMLAPMPLVAFGAPVRLATALIGVGATLYVLVAALVGHPGGWYVATHLGGMLVVALTCAVQGRSAARQRAELTRLSVVDVLTDCLNRRGFEERFAAEVSHAHRTDRAVCLLIFDLDGFKEVNDTRGHAAGDELLRWVAATLAGRLHPHDVVGRLGGDEFVVLLTSVSVPQAGTAAERLRADLAERTSASVGVATLGLDGDSFEALYTRADARLYADKARHGATRRGGPAPA